MLRLFRREVEQDYPTGDMSESGTVHLEWIMINSTFCLIGQFLFEWWKGFQSQTTEFEPPCTASLYHMKVMFNNFHLNGHALASRVSSTDFKVRTTWNSIINITTWKWKGFQLQARVWTTLSSMINSITWEYCLIAFIWMVTH